MPYGSDFVGHHAARIALLVRTISQLQFRQIFYQIWYRINKRPRVKVQAPPLPRGGEATTTFIPGAGAIYDGMWRFRFLNLERRFATNAIDWRSEDVPKLWRYNLHYQDYLHACQLGDEQRAALIESWIADNPAGAADAWEPYPLSLRIVNWVKYFFELGARNVPDSWQASLAHQVRWLERRIEYHLLANHLFKNGVALVFAGAWFDGPEGDRWLCKGGRLLERELAEQFLPDGGHYERSPMYHAISVVDCLDILNILSNCRAPSATKLCEAILRIITPAIDYLRDTTLPDGKLALFNDAAHGIAPEVSQIFDYSERLLGKATEPPGIMGFQLISRRDTGYFGYRDGNEGLLIDCGPVGPDYQPGHAHCDALSFEWVLGGRRIVVDCGTYNYEPGARRAYARGTRGHNTVQVDGEEQSEIWGTFRVARRARAELKSCLSVARQFVFEGGHDGYQRLRGMPYVTRRLTRETPGHLLIEERIEGQGLHRIDSFLHFHPDLRVAIYDSYAAVATRDGVQIVIIDFIGVSTVALNEGEYYPEFGIAQRNAELTFCIEGYLPVSFGYLLRKAP